MPTIDRSKLSASPRSSFSTGSNHSWRSSFSTGSNHSWCQGSQGTLVFGSLPSTDDPSYSTNSLFELPVAAFLCLAALDRSISLGPRFDGSLDAPPCFVAVARRRWLGDRVFDPLSTSLYPFQLRRASWPYRFSVSVEVQYVGLLQSDRGCHHIRQ
jgi:hypothetical protein